MPVISSGVLNESFCSSCSQASKALSRIVPYIVITAFFNYLSCGSLWTIKGGSTDWQQHNEPLHSCRSCCLSSLAMPPTVGGAVWPLLPFTFPLRDSSTPSLASKFQKSGIIIIPEWSVLVRLFCSFLFPPFFHNFLISSRYQYSCPE